MNVGCGDLDSGYPARFPKYAYLYVVHPTLTLTHNHSSPSEIQLTSFPKPYVQVSNYSNPAALGEGNWSLFSSLAVNLCIAVLVQTFFSVRIFRISSPKVRWWITSSIVRLSSPSQFTSMRIEFHILPKMVIVLAHFAFGLETVILMFIKKRFSALPDITLNAAMPFALTAVLSDICIATALCVLLHNKRSVFRKTNILVNTLIIYAINRCLLTSIVATVEVIVFAVSPHSLWFLAIDFVIGKLYANSLLASLNSRSSLRGRGLESDTASSIRINRVHLSDLRSSGSEEERERSGRVQRSDDDGTRADANYKNSAVMDLKSVPDRGVVDIVP
ncbi:hypothetical protein BJ138DRAFT_1113182 [Hygrophoropsis aurantiaca]|uniref:Uncharacterized protein n=1 Tax=Hygrophoropsis aurantiaca TaxID=72124 RepID=A0ACB8AEY5_9AGAM|nr:hypothetical protein BJ138DRAFT_1113182 [Hygrophoropsis aurantiaca]